MRPATVEAWCAELIESTPVATKLNPAPPPDPSLATSWEAAPEPRRLVPGRPPGWIVVARSPKTPSPGALVHRSARLRLLHTLLHHELQAAELFAWALLAFPETPHEFRVGLLGLCRSELEHLALYRGHLERLGGTVGELPVRDWFWERAAACPAAPTFIALLGLGLEGANLEHTARFESAFQAAGDVDGARILAKIGEEEVGHVAFAAHWFERLTGAPLDFERWRTALPQPLTPALFRGRPLNRGARARAGMDAAFCDALEATPGAEGTR